MISLWSSVILCDKGSRDMSPFYRCGNRNIKIKWLAPSLISNDWPWDSSSDFLTLNSLQSPSLMKDPSSSHWMLPVIHLPGQPLWYDILENFPLQDSGIPQNWSFSSLTWQTFNVWNSNPIIFKSLFRPNIRVKSCRAVWPVRPKKPSAWGPQAFQGAMGEKNNWLQATQKQTEINKHLVNCLQNVTLCQLH